jgi:hypothetical protein
MVGFSSDLRMKATPIVAKLRQAASQRRRRERAVANACSCACRARSVSAALSAAGFR